MLTLPGIDPGGSRHPDEAAIDASNVFAGPQLVAAWQRGQGLRGRLDKGLGVRPAIKRTPFFYRRCHFPSRCYGRSLHW